MNKDSLSAAERETTITSTDDDDVVRIWTCQRRYLGGLRRDPRFTQVRSGAYGLTEWGEFTIPADLWTPVIGARRRRAPLTEERKAALRDQLAQVRVGGQVKNDGNDEDEGTPEDAA